MGARYMCGHLGIGDTRYHDVPFVPSQDCANWESCQEEAYKQGREDQGELNADTVREIHELVYQQGIEKGRADKYQEIVSEYMLLTEKQVADIRADVIDRIKDTIHEIYKNQFYCMEDFCEHSKPTADMCVDCFYDAIQKCLEQLKEQK